MLFTINDHPKHITNKGHIKLELVRSIYLIWRPKIGPGLYFIQIRIFYNPMLHWIIVPKSDFRNILIFYEIEPCTHCHTIIYLPSAYDYIYRHSFISRIKPCHCLSVLLWGMVHAFLKSLSTYNLNHIVKKDFKLAVIFVKKNIIHLFAEKGDTS